MEIKNFDMHRISDRTRHIIDVVEELHRSSIEAGTGTARYRNAYNAWLDLKTALNKADKVAFNLLEQIKKPDGETENA